MEIDAFTRWSSVNNVEKPYIRQPERDRKKPKWHPGEYIKIILYKNRKLCLRGIYINHSDMASMIKAGCKIRVVRHADGEDVTEGVLKNIVVEKIKKTRINIKDAIDVISGKVSLERFLSES